MYFGDSVQLSKLKEIYQQLELKTDDLQVYQFGSESQLGRIQQVQNPFFKRSSNIEQDSSSSLLLQRDSCKNLKKITRNWKSFKQQKSVEGLAQVHQLKMKQLNSEEEEAQQLEQLEKSKKLTFGQQIETIIQKKNQKQKQFINLPGKIADIDEENQYNMTLEDMKESKEYQQLKRQNKKNRTITIGKTITYGENPLGPLEELDDDDFTPKINKSQIE